MLTPFTVADETVKGLAELTGDPRFAYDSYRRLIQATLNPHTRDQ